MKFKPATLLPFGIAALVVGGALLLHGISRRTGFSADDKISASLVEQIEGLTYDARVRLGARWNDPSSVSPLLAILVLDNEVFKKLNNGSLDATFASVEDEQGRKKFRAIWPWSRFIYGQMVREISAQGAAAIGFDFLFAETDNSDILARDGTNLVPSDEFFALQLARAGNVYLGMDEVLPAPLVRTNARGMGSIERQDGEMRWVKPFKEVREWHPLIRALEKPLGLEFARAAFPNATRLVIPIAKTPADLDPQPLVVHLNANGTLKLTADGALDLSDDPEDNGPDNEPPFRIRRVWNLGLALAADVLKLDLESPEFRPDAIRLRGPEGLAREIPTDGRGNLCIDWSLRFNDLVGTNLHIYLGQLPELLINDAARQLGDTSLDTPYRGRVVLIGSVASGNNISDIGRTPLGSQTPLLTAHVNLANSLLMGRFVRRTSFPIEAAVTIALGVLATWVSWRSRVPVAAVAVLGLMIVYSLFTFWLYVDHRVWLALVTPLAGGLLGPHAFVLGYRVIFEQQEKRRVRNIFSRIVAPEVVQELLGAEKLSLGGSRRKITVFFADVRGFTEFTDARQAAAEEHVRQTGLAGDAAERYYDAFASETLQTVNLYLATIADVIKQHHGTLDKYIGDCVMAFWGSPVPDPRHATNCTRAAVAAQRAIFELNQKRFAENEARKQENVRREAAGQPPLPLLAMLTLGTGINTGYAVVGLMGSEATIANYTVFGREVNLASRLEGVSGRGRVIISESTYQEIKRDDPELAARCTLLPPTIVKGFRQPVPILEVAWKITPPATATATPAAAAPPPPAPAPTD